MNGCIKFTLNPEFPLPPNVSGQSESVVRNLRVRNLKPIIGGNKYKFFKLKFLSLAGLYILGAKKCD